MPLKQHWWRCDGPCQDRSPFFGWVKRATNRVPGPWDSWWRSHSHGCGGRFVKVKEPINYTEKRVKGLFSYGVSSPTSRITLNNFGFEFIHCAETFGRKNKIESASPYAFVSKGQNTNRNDLVECPMCMKRIPNGVISEHLKVCGDLQRLFEEDRVDVDENDCGDRRKGEVDISACPLCDKALFNGYVKEHLEQCDRLQGIFEDDNVGSTDVTCPCCYTEVRGDLSSHIARCLRRDILSISNENYFESGTKGEEEIETCLVCQQTLRNISLKDHLENCESLQGVFDDNNVVLEDNSDCKDCVDTKSVQHCPFCDLKVAEMADHLRTCLSSQDEPDSTSTATEVRTLHYISSHSVNTGKSALNSCPICGLEGRNDLKEHLERECLRTLDFSEESNFSFYPGNNKTSVRNSCVKQDVFGKNGALRNLSDLDFSACNERSGNNARSLPISKVKRGSNNDVKSSLLNSDNSRRKGIGINGSCANVAENRTIGNQTNLRDYSEPLIFCRSCGKFYSVAFCPVCCGSK